MCFRATLCLLFQVQIHSLQEILSASKHIYATNMRRLSQLRFGSAPSTKPCSKAGAASAKQALRVMAVSSDGVMNFARFVISTTLTYRYRGCTVPSHCRETAMFFLMECIRL